MKNLYLILALSFIPIISYSQNDSTLVEQLNRPVINCETVAFNSQNMLSKFDISQTDSINEILDIWLNICGEVEPIVRLEILRDIYQNNLNDSSYKDYATHYIHKYNRRIKSAESVNYNEIFEYYKSYYSYVPLRSKFDEMTKIIAEKLLKEQKKGTSEYLFCLLFSEEIDLFYDELKSKEYKENFVKSTIYDEKYETWQRGMNYNLLVGAWLPVGKLSNTFSLSPNFGLRAGFAYANSLRFDIGVNLRVHINDKPFEINADDTIKEANGDVGLTAGLWLTKEFKLKNKLMIDAIGGIGVGVIDTDLEKINPDPDSSSEYYSIETVDLSVGLNIRKRVFVKSSIGLNISYHFAPYNLIVN